MHAILLVRSPNDSAKLIFTSKCIAGISLKSSVTIVALLPMPSGPSLVPPLGVAILHFSVSAVCAWYDSSLVNMISIRGWISLLLMVAALYSLFVCVQSDPGIVQKDSAISEIDSSRYPLTPRRNRRARSSDFELTDLMHRETPTKFRGSDASANRYCSICDLEQPLRSKHCTELNRCVRTHDHYCPWISNCVGEWNRPHFLGYLMAETFALLWFNANAFSKLAENAGVRKNQLASFTALILAIVIMSIFLLMTSLLSVYHCFLACANLTTWEQTSWRRITYLSNLKQNDGSPFCRESVLENIKQYLRVPGSVDIGPDGGVLWHVGTQRSVLPFFCSCCNEC